VDIDPLSVLFNFQLGAAYSWCGQHDEAIAQLQKTIELNPLFAPAYQTLAFAYLRKGMFQEATELAEKGFALSGGDHRSKALLAGVGALSGKQDEARAVLRELKQQSGPPNFLHAYRFAGIHALLGEMDDAFEWLERAWQGRSGDRLPSVRSGI